MFSDPKVRRTRQYGFIPASSFHVNLVTAVSADAAISTGTAAAFNAGVSTLPFSGNDATAYLAEVSTFGISGFRMDTDGDTARTIFCVPADVNRARPFYLRPVWTTASQTSADTVLWTVKYEKFAAGVALSATVNDTLDTAIAEDTVGTTTAYLLQKTAWGVINQDKLTPGELIILEVAMTTKAVGLTEALVFLGLEYSFEPSKEVNVGTDDALEAPAA